MLCPTCHAEMLLVAAPGKTGNWCCTRGAACEQRAIPAKGLARFRVKKHERVAAKDFKRVKFGGSDG